MGKILVDEDRLNELIKLADLSGHSVCNDGIIRDCVLNCCGICAFHDGLNCAFDFAGYRGIKEWLKSEEVYGKDRCKQE